MSARMRCHSASITLNRLVLFRITRGVTELFAVHLEKEPFQLQTVVGIDRRPGEHFGAGRGIVATLALPPPIRKDGRSRRGGNRCRDGFQSFKKS